MPGLFDDLIPEPQQAAVQSGGLFDDLIPAPKPEKTWGETAQDAAQGLYSGAVKGGATLAGLGGDVAQGVNWVAEKIARKAFGDETVDKAKADRAANPTWADRNIGAHIPTSRATIAAAEKNLPGVKFDPQTTAGQYAETVGEFLPSSVLGPGGMVRNALTQGVAPAVASEAAGQLTKGTAAEPYARLVGALAGAPTAALAAERVAPTRATPLAAASERSMVDVPRFAATESPTTGYLASKMAQLPIVGSPIRSAYRNMEEQLGQRVDAAAARLGRSTPNEPRITAYGAGTTAKDAITDWIEHGSDAVNSRLYGRVDALVDPAITRDLTHTRAEIARINAQQANATTRAANPAIALVEDAATRPGGLNFTGVKELRTELGERLSGKITPEAGTSQPALNRLYAALSRDLRETAEAAGGPQAREAFDRANRVASQIAERRNDLAKVIGTKGQMSPEKVTDAVMGMASSKARGDIDRLETVLRTVGPEGRDHLAGQALARMGRDPSNGQFSSQRFLTAFNGMTADARRLLFGSTSIRDLQQRLGDIETIARRSQEFSRMGNPSGTGGVVALTAGLGALGSMQGMGEAAAAGGLGLTASALMARRLRAMHPLSATRTATQGMVPGAFEAQRQAAGQ